MIFRLIRLSLILALLGISNHCFAQRAVVRPPAPKVTKPPSPKNKAPKSGKLIIRDAVFGNFDFNGREIYPYGSSLKASDIVVLKPRIIYDWSGPSDLCKTKELYLKYYNSDGDLIKFAIDSQEEVTYVGTITFHTGTLNTAYFSKFDDSFIVPKPREAESSPLDEDEYITSITSLLINRNIHRQYNYHSGRIRVEIYCDNTLLWSGYVMLH